MATRKPKPLLIAVVAVIILAAIVAIAIPMWNAHKVQQRVTSAVSAADGAKLAVMEAATVAGSITKVKSGDVGYKTPENVSRFVKQIAVGDGGVITIATQGTGATPDPVLALTPHPGNNGVTNPTGGITWQCTLVAGDNSTAPNGCSAKVVTAQGSMAMPSSSAMPAHAASTDTKQDATIN